MDHYTEEYMIEQLVEFGLTEEEASTVLYYREFDQLKLISKSLTDASYRVLLNKELNLLKEGSLLIASAISAGSIPAMAPVALATLIWLYVDYRTKAIKLNATQGILLSHLKRYSDQTTEEIFSALHPDLNLSQDQIEDELAKLQKFNRPNYPTGKVTLVTKNADDQWSAVNI